MAEKTPWKPIADASGYLAPDGVIVETKISDENGERNYALLRRRGSLWWLYDNSMYVYYTPTHWRDLVGGVDRG